MTANETRYLRLDPGLVEALKRYVENRCPTGDFLEAVLSNDLREAFGRADEHNRETMFEIVCYCWNELPAVCWGSRERVKDWLKNDTTNSD